MDALRLRVAAAADLSLLQHWDEQEHVLAADPNDDWGWEQELGRFVDWRWMLIAELGQRALGFVQIIDPAREESHYWGEVADKLRAIDIWIGAEQDLNRGYGTRMMALALLMCFADHDVEAVLVDPLADNLASQRWYQRCGFEFVEPRRFGLDQCNVYRLERQQWRATLAPLDADWQPLLEHWFGSDDDGGAQIAERQAALWWGKSASADSEMRRRFEGHLQHLIAGGLDSWQDSAKGWLAALLLLDQLPRMIYRDTPLAFAFDALARRLCLQGLEQGLHLALRPVQRVFCYLPLEHAEDLQCQQQAVALFRELADTVTPDERTRFDSFVDFALAHQRVIEAYGRFPHRNRILGRQSSAEELEFLSTPGSSF